MASTTQKWFIGCGIGCGFIILIIAVIGGGIFFAVKDVVKEAESIEESQEALREVFGGPDEFIPAADGSIAPHRMEAFLATREATRESREKLAQIIYLLDDDDGVEVEANALDKIKAGLTLIPSVLSFMGERNQHLLENNIRNIAKNCEWLGDVSVLRFLCPHHLRLEVLCRRLCLLHRRVFRHRLHLGGEELQESRLLQSLFPCLMPFLDRSELEATLRNSSSLPQKRCFWFAHRAHRGMMRGMASCLTRIWSETALRRRWHRGNTSM